MLSVLGSSNGVTRRRILQAGTLAGLGGLALPGLWAAEESSRKPGDETSPGPPGVAARAKHIIVIYLLGGAATQDMFDLKPDAPTGVKSEFKPIATSAPGISLCEHLP